METVMACFNVLFYNLARETRRNHKAQMYCLVDKDSKSQSSQNLTETWSLDMKSFE
jgi:hypothetical protein